MATYQKFNSFVEALAEKKHNLWSDQLVIALTNVAPVATNSVLADLTEVDYTNISSRNLTTSLSAQTSWTYKLVVADLVLIASGVVPTFRYIVIYNDTAANKELIGFYDYGSDIDLLTSQQFVLDFDQTDWVIQIA